MQESLALVDCMVRGTNYSAMDSPGHVEGLPRGRGALSHVKFSSNNYSSYHKQSQVESTTVTCYSLHKSQDVGFSHTVLAVMVVSNHQNNVQNGSGSTMALGVNSIAT